MTRTKLFGVTFMLFQPLCLDSQAGRWKPLQQRVYPVAGCAGGEGATAREVLRHKSVEKVVMVDIDKVVCDFCHAHLEHNKAAFESPKLELINDDARAQLEQYPGKFDVIIGDLADPLEDGPCYQLYTQVGALELPWKHAGRT